MLKETENYLTDLESVSDGAEPFLTPPYRVAVTIQGTTSLLFHRWNVEGVEEKANATKGSKAKKTDDLESYVYRNEKKEICLPGEYLRMACVWAAKYRQDPRSPRKSAMDLYKAGLVSDTELAPIEFEGKPLLNWSFVDQRRCVVQRNAITRRRPAVDKGWEATLFITVLLPDYISPQDLQSVLTQAGILVGVGDFRPTYGRYMLTRFQLLKEE